tara:strand:- start:3394 stop:4503 length:1110 start_codon:yes stop_codon:yes gene_type:complete
MVIKKAKGCYIFDSNGNQYIDTTMGSGAQIIGHNNELIRKTFHQVKKGTIYTIPNHHTDKVNKRLKKINPHFHNEYIFCNSGTEANMRAIRLARAYTKKGIIGRFHGGWHGGLDGCIEGDGVPSETNSLFKILPYNDDKCFDMLTEDMAAVIIEPSQGSNPRTDVGEFLHELRKRCDELDIVLIFDEVMSGFRIARGGGQELFQIQPDLITYGKVLGGGFPIGCLGGKTEIMNTDNVFFGGTFSANPLSMYSAKNILKCIEEETLIDYDHLESIGDYFRRSLNEFFELYNIKKRAIGSGAINRILHTDKFVRNREDRDNFEDTNQDEFYEKLLKHGVFVNGNRIFHLSMCHSMKIMKKMVKIICEVCDE